MTDTLFTRTALTEAAKGAGVTTDQARAILEAAGVKVEREKPALPTDPESAIIATEVRGVTGKWRMMLDRDGSWFSPARASGGWWHQPEDITKWTEAVVLPVTATPVTLTEDQVVELHEAERLKDPAGGGVMPLRSLKEAVRAIHTATVNAALAQHAAPVEGEPISLDDVRAGDRVRLVLNNGDEVTFTVTRVDKYYVESYYDVYPQHIITSVYLLDREGEA